MRVLLTIIFIYILLSLLYESGYKKTTDEDYYIETEEYKPVVDTFPYYKYIKPRDTTAYKGKWVDIQMSN